MLTELLNYALNHNIPYEQCKNMCDCCNYTNYMHVWIDGRIHTLYALDDGTFKLDNDVVTTFNQVLKKLGLEKDEQEERKVSNTTSKTRRNSKK